MEFERQFFRMHEQVLRPAKCAICLRIIEVLLWLMSVVLFAVWVRLHALYINNNSTMLRDALEEQIYHG